MAYEPKAWSCGDVITANDLNHIEQGIAESGGGDAGYECTESRQTLTEESITTQQGQAPYASMGLSYNTLIDADVLKVTFNGTEYTCEKQVMDSNNFYGGFSENGPDFSEYPFLIMSSPNGSVATNILFTETEGTYSIKIESFDMTVETTPCFENAVKSVVGDMPKYVKDGTSASVVEGDVNQNVASAHYSHAEGRVTTASGHASHAEGDGSEASGDFSHAEGHSTASGTSAHAEGYGTTASRDYAHAEGYGTTASGTSAHAEGRDTIASGTYAHAEGNGTTASNDDSHAEGQYTTASGAASHAEGNGTTASGTSAHAEGNGTIANHRSQHVFGENNVADPSTATSDNRGNYIEIVGNGSTSNSRSNARTLDWSGNEVLQGSLTLGKGTADETTITATQLKALLALLNA